MRTIFVRRPVNIASVAIAVLTCTLAVLVEPAFGASAPAITFGTPTTSAFTASVTFTVNRAPRQIATLSCKLTSGAGVTSTASCGQQSGTKTTTTSVVTLSSLGAGTYTYTVTVAATDGGRTTGSTRFTISPVAPVCTVTPYHVTSDAHAHTATGGCTGLGGVALPSSYLDLSGTTHSAAGSYSDTWSFADPAGNYSPASGTITDTIDPSTTVSQALPPIIGIHINYPDDPQIPAIPPADVGYCPPQNSDDGGCAINPLDGTVTNTFDATPTIDPNVDPTHDTVTYHWQLFYPPGAFGSGAVYASAGITGYHSPILNIVPSALPDLSLQGSNPYWTAELTVTINGVASQSVFFRFIYASDIPLLLSTACLTTGLDLNGQPCSVTTPQLLPPSEPA